jgi:hypothetical protein
MTTALINYFRRIFSGFFIRGRHHLLSTIFIAHPYFATDKLLRLNSEYIAILRANSKRDLKLIVSDFNIEGVDENSILRYYNQAIRRGVGQFLFVDSVKSELRYNFDKPAQIQKIQKMRIKHCFAELTNVDAFECVDDEASLCEMACSHNHNLFAD